ncbi:hypothetical protein TSAR_008924 [Trichomalopsis sarcophagae]|uniref:Transposable element P transposase-like GTP-binding insertion domain-containing protein n=1 Tax=Trichomalopsis sarcophagae TaxID=543379 RepID=A0A232ER17_9HYME|nr:hypothetical protein TSAR_008924 [Trichomalopsis sarcophagae]
MVKLYYNPATHATTHHTVTAGHPGDKRTAKIFKDLIKAWELDRSHGTSNVLGHLSENHFNPNHFDAMKVKLAFQLLSQRMASAIRLAGEDPNGLMLSATWKASADFVENLNAVIDACNSLYLYSTNPLKRPLSDRNPEIQQRLEKFVVWSKDWVVPSGKTVSKPPCFSGIPLTVNALLRSHDKILINGNVIISFKDLIKTWELDKSHGTSNVLGHLSENHFNPNNFDAMKVKLAFQLLSQRMASAIRLAGEDPNGLISSATWKASTDFVENLNAVIDACNYLYLYSTNPLKRPLSDRNLQIQQRLEKFVVWSKDWVVL